LEIYSGALLGREGLEVKPSPNLFDRRPVVLLESSD